MFFRFRLLPGLLTIAMLFIAACNTPSEILNPCSTPPQVSVANVTGFVQGLRMGSIIVSGSGQEPLSYSIDGINFQPGVIFEGLAPGSYTVTVRDANNCENTNIALVNDNPLVSYLRDIRPILTDNCQISSCHCDGNSLCFATYEVVKEYSQGIKARTAGRAMPPEDSGKFLTEQQIRAIGDWVDQGAMNN
ncbi:MAG: hypothetical protein R3D00_18745 [Bacteroidia bacterium]